jgi:2-iminoacetate synthase
MVSAVDGIAAPHPVADRDLIQLVMALRLVLPDSPIVVSTREPPRLRDVLARLGATIMSAGSRTTPGGYTSGTVEGKGQFDVEDLRSPEEVSDSLRRLGLDPVWKDWERSIA